MTIAPNTTTDTTIIITIITIITIIIVAVVVVMLDIANWTKTIPSAHNLVNINAYISMILSSFVLLEI